MVNTSDTLTSNTHHRTPITHTTEYRHPSTYAMITFWNVWLKSQMRMQSVNYTSHITQKSLAKIRTPNTLRPGSGAEWPPRRLCHRPAVLFRQLKTALSISQATIRRTFKKVTIIFSILFKMGYVWNYVTWNYVRRGVFVYDNWAVEANASALYEFQ